MEPHPTTRPEVHTDAFLRRLMRGQLRLSMACAATFLVALFGLPLLNYCLPEFMATRVLGFTLSWLVLGVLFFPLVWLIAWVFIRRSIELEQREIREVSGAAKEEGGKAGKQP
jgi:uncharacterized membrane protein (DUF485 family)